MRAVRVLEKLARRGDDRLVEALHFGGDARREARRVEQRDRRGAVSRPVERFPRRGGIVAERRDEADAGDRDAATWFHCASIPISRRAVATTRPSVAALSIALLMPSSGGASSTP